MSGEDVGLVADDVDEVVRQPDPHEAPRRVLGQCLGDGRAEAAETPVLFDRDHELGVLDGAQQAVDVQGLEGVHVEHADVVTQLVCSLERGVHGQR